MKDIVLAEKPSVARDIQAVIAPRAIKKDGYMEDNKYIITYAIGHLIGLAEPQHYDPKYVKWNLEDLPIIPENIKLVAMKSTLSQFKVIRQLLTANNAGTLIIATDAGREGQLIGEYIYMATACNLPVKRLWISSMTDEAIRKGFANLKPGYEYKNLADAAKCRSEMDWIIGMSATRGMTIKSNTLMPIGRVMTPTLAFIVNRELEIQSFTIKPFYEVIASFEGKYAGIWLNEDDTRTYHKEEANKIINLTQGKPGTVTDVKTEDAIENPPLLHDLADLQKEANTLYGYPAAVTLDLAQALYQNHKVLSYPRTDCRYLDSTLKQELPKIIAALKGIPEVKEHIPKQLLLTSRIINDKKMEGADHHAIIPTEKVADLAILSPEEKNIYLLVVRRFVSVFLPSHKFKKTLIITDIEGEKFRTTGKVSLDIGWKVLYLSIQNKEDETKEEDHSLPIIKIGDKYIADPVQLVDKMTSPPKRYTEATLITAMETASKYIEDENQREILKETGGIGTPATRAAIIEKLIDNKFIARKKKNLVPTDFGIKTIEFIPVEDLKSAALTAIWEQKLKQVEKGISTRVQFKNDMKNYALQVISKIKSSQSQDLNENKNTPIGTCPICGGKIIEGKKSFSCSNWKETNCKFTIWKKIATKKITKTIAQELLKKGITKELTGFQSKTKKSFNAKLKIEGAEIKFIFSSEKGRECNE